MCPDTFPNTVEFVIVKVKADVSVIMIVFVLPRHCFMDLFCFFPSDYFCWQRIDNGWADRNVAFCKTRTFAHVCVPNVFDAGSDGGSVRIHVNNPSSCYFWTEVLVSALFYRAITVLKWGKGCEKVVKSKLFN